MGIDRVGYESVHYIAKLKADRASLLSDFAILDEKVSAWKGQWSAITRDMNSFLKEKGINFYELVDHYKKTNSKKESVAL